MGFFNRVNIAELIETKDLAGLENCLNTGDAAIQFQAAEALAGFGNWKGFAFLVLSTQHKKPSIRAAAAETLGNIDDPRAIRTLARLLKDDDEDVQQSAKEALRAINTIEAIQTLAFSDTDDRFNPNMPAKDDNPNASINDAIFGGASQCDISGSCVTDLERQQSADRYFILASKYYDEDRFTQALTEVNHAMEARPDLAEAANLKGLILEALGEHYQALLAYQKALHLDKNLDEAKENKTGLMLELEIDTTPLQDFLDGAMAEEWDMRLDAVAALSARTEPEALQAIIKALYDEDLEVCTAALDALESNAAPEAAIAIQHYFSSLDQVDEEDLASGTYSDRADLYSLKEEPRSETSDSVKLETTNRFTPRNRTSSEFSDEAANLMDAGEYALANVNCQLALLTDSYNSDALNLLGILHEENGEFRQAYFAYKNAVACDPTFEEARSNLEELVREYGEAFTRFDTLLTDLNSGEDDLIYEAIVNLGELTNPDAIEYLVPLLDHPKRKIVLAAVEALDKLNATDTADDIMSLSDKFWSFSTPPVKMNLDQIERSRSQCLKDWSDRCQIIISLARLGAFIQLKRILPKEFLRLSLLSDAFNEVGVDIFDVTLQITTDLVNLINKKYTQDLPEY